MEFFFQNNESFFSLDEPAIFVFKFSALFIVTIVASALVCLEIGLLIQRQALKRGEPVETEENHLDSVGEFCLISRATSKHSDRISATN